MSCAVYRPGMLGLSLSIHGVVSWINSFVSVRARGFIDQERVNTFGSSTVLLRALQGFCQSHPGVTVRLRDSIGGNLVELVRSGETDFGVGAPVGKHRDVVTEHLCTERISVFAPATHALASKRYVTLRELIEFPAILSEKHTSTRLALERAMHEHRLSVRPFHETSHISKTIGMVNAGLGSAVLPVWPQGSPSIRPYGVTKKAAIVFGRERTDR
jgi:DNA-binding transcriptional LysR family regulator